MKNTNSSVTKYLMLLPFVVYQMFEKMPQPHLSNLQKHGSWHDHSLKRMCVSWIFENKTEFWNSTRIPLDSLHYLVDWSGGSWLNRLLMTKFSAE